LHRPYNDEAGASISPPQPIPQKLLKLARGLTESANSAAAELIDAAKITALGMRLIEEVIRHDFTLHQTLFLLRLIVETYSFDHTDDIWMPADAAVPVLTGLESDYLRKRIIVPLKKGQVIGERSEDGGHWFRVLQLPWGIGERTIKGRPITRDQVEAAASAVKHANHKHEDGAQTLLNLDSPSFGHIEFKDTLHTSAREAAAVQAVSDNLSVTNSTGRDVGQSRTDNLSASRSPGLSERQWQGIRTDKLSGTVPAITGTVIENVSDTLINVGAHGQKSREEILQKVQASIGRESYFKRGHRYFRKFFDNDGPHTAEALWMTALEFECQDKAGMDEPAAVFVTRYHEILAHLKANTSKKAKASAPVFVDGPTLSEENAEGMLRKHGGWQHAESARLLKLDVSNGGTRATEYDDECLRKGVDLMATAATPEAIAVLSAAGFEQVVARIL
jgi:hypothetical protein